MLDSRRTLVYRGAVDDQYGIDYTKTEAGPPLLAAALDDLVAGRRIRTPATRAPGCELGLAPATSADGAGERVTYHRHVSRIVQAHCLECHHVGGAGPFPLDSYDAVAGRAATIRRVLQDGFMPPWFAAPGGRALGQRPQPERVGAAHAVPLARRRACRRATPPTRRCRGNTRSGWTIGTPDLVVELPKRAGGARRGLPRVPVRRGRPGLPRGPLGAGGADPAERAGATSTT